MINGRWLVALSVIALTIGILGCGDDDASSSLSPAATGTAIPTTVPLAIDLWADQVCALAVQAAGTLNVPPPASSLSLVERKQRAAGVLAPRADSLRDVAGAIAALDPPESAAAFNEVFHSTMRDVVSAWQSLVNIAASAQTEGELDTANEAFIQAQASADAQVVTAHDVLDAAVKAALAAPLDCGVLNNVRS